MSQLKIISDGTAKGTRVVFGDSFIEGITRIKINPIKPGGLVSAEISICQVALELAIKDADIECPDGQIANQLQQIINQALDTPENDTDV